MWSRGVCVREYLCCYYYYYYYTHTISERQSRARVCCARTIAALFT